MLESGAAGTLLAAALRCMGYPLRSWRLLQIHSRPGAGVTGVYSVAAGAGREAAAPAPSFLCVTTAVLPSEAEGIVSLRGARQQTFSVWAHPRDPLLPGLVWATDPGAVSALFAPADGAGMLRGPASLRTAGYRPLRRAVIIAELGGERRYLKVLRRGQGEELLGRHRLLRDAGIPVPEATAVPGEDVVSMHQAAGRPLAGLLLKDGAAGVDPHALVGLVQGLPAAVLGLPRHPPWSERVRTYGRSAAAVLPASAQRIHALSATIDDLVRSTDAGPVVPSHGDFYEANLLITGGRVSGLLDIDALGPGHLVDDLGCFLGHLAVLPAVHREYVHIPAALERFAGIFGRYVEPAALYARAAGVALTLVAGAKRRAGLP
ncbi:phosphotransferase, partial [Arthrobacter sp. Br18]|uniref:phosphotransferase n=1 Tax=Arthrobacter sp. Br18 TaxID=1312954 RepID=UPI00068891C5